jgi:UrcA family protein
LPASANVARTTDRWSGCAQHVLEDRRNQPEIKETAMNKNLDSKLFAAFSSLILVAAVGIAGHALAADSASGSQIKVKYADLNVNDSAGAAVLFHRIRAAANEVCGVGRDRDLSRMIEAQSCAKKAVSDAVAAVNAPALTGLYQAKVGGATKLASIR